MRQSQLPLLGLLLALFVGSRVGTPGSASEGGPAASSAGNSYSSSSQLAKQGAGRVPRHSGKQRSSGTEVAAASDVVQNGCDEVPATSKASTFHISKSQRTAVVCLPPLPAIYKILCQLNPHYSSSDDLRHGFELQELQAEKPVLPQCLAGLSGDEKPGILSVMASVPDPEHTHLGLLTDRTIEAIQVAAGKAGFNPYSHFLPWTSFDTKKNLDDASASEGEADSHEPGILIFRKQESVLIQPPPLPPPQYLAVFLIPELPTTGLDKEAFFGAKSIMDQVSDQLKQGKSPFIPFAGPNFSGSLASLADIDGQLGKVGEPDQAEPTECIHAFSGQVTAAAYLNDKGKDACTSVLVPTQTPDREAVPLFVNGLRDYGYRPEEIAVLSEGGTAFGNQAARIGEKNKKDDKDEDEVEVAKCDPPKSGNPDPQHLSICGVLYLQFPREISKLRNAYGAETGKTTPTGSANQQTSDVQMSWQDSQATRGDDMPTYGGRQTPLSQEAVLSTLANILKTRQIRVLGILATDPMDKAFLIHSFRKSSPDVRLFLRDPDLLYLRTPDVGSLNGTLLVNNYPLIPRNQVWSSEDASEGGPSDRPVTFPSAGQEAQYDAFLLLLQAMNFEFSDGSKNPPLLEWNWPAGKSRPLAAKVAPATPPLWLTTIGTAGHFPLAILKVDQSIDESHFDPRTLNVGDPRYTGWLLWMFFVMLGLLHVWGLSYPNALPRLFSDDFDLGDATDTITASKAVCHVAILLIVALIQFILGSSYVFFRHLNSLYARLAWFVIFVAGILAATACLVFLIRVAWPWRSRGEANFRNEEISGVSRPLLGGIFCVVIFGVIGALWVYGVFQPKFSIAFLHFRDIILVGGVAPCLPIVLLLVVAYLGAWAYLRRLTYWGYRKPQMPNLALDDVFPSDFRKKIDGIDKCILVFLENWGWGFALVSVSALGIFGFRPRTNMDMIEAVQVRLTVQILFGLAFFALALNWFRFINIWSLLRYILQGLERLPIRHAFERMPAEKSMPIWGWGISDNSFLPTTQGVERLRALVREDASVIDPLSVADLKSRINALGRFEGRKKGIFGLLFLLLQKQQPGLVELSRVVGGSRTIVVDAGRGNLIAKSVPNRLGRLLIASRDAMLEVVNQLIRFLSPDYWRRGSDGSQEETLSKPELRTFVLAEDLVAMRYYTYIRYVVTELRNLLFFVVMAFSLLFLAFHSYAFRADQAIDWSFLVLFLILGAGVTVVLYQMELDPILSHFGGGQPGEVGWSFYLNLLKYGAVPFLTVIGSQVPTISNLLLRWVQPTLQSLR